jgi:sugar lactone lactonase YvrE
VGHFKCRAHSQCEYEIMKLKMQVLSHLWALVLATVVGGGAQQTKGATGPQATEPAPSFNPLKIALLHWYSANRTTAFAVGDQPYEVCFDGENIWVANYGGSSVTKLRAADGAVLGTFTVPLGPYGVAFDGANVWVTGSVNGNVTKLRASDGKNLGTFPVGKLPFWLAFDGANIWVANADFTDNTVTKLRASDGKNLGTFPVG